VEHASVAVPEAFLPADTLARQHLHEAEPAAAHVDELGVDVPLRVLEEQPLLA
jgi:hypothetical protein